MRRIIVGAVAFALLVSCASIPPDTPEEAAVVVTVNTQDTAGCKLLGHVEGYDAHAWGGDPLRLPVGCFDGSTPSKRCSIRTQAVKLGANLVWVPQDQKSGANYWNGQAYKCPS